MKKIVCVNKKQNVTMQVYNEYSVLVFSAVVQHCLHDFFSLVLLLLVI